MNIKETTINANGHINTYLVADDGRNKPLYFTVGTPKPVIELLHREYTSAAPERLALDYGDKVTGESYGERYDIMGYVGASMGLVRAPILLNNSRSNGGVAILTDCIIGVYAAKGKRVLWKHPKAKTRTNW